MTASDGETTALSSMKSPRCEIFFLADGSFSEIGLLRDLQNLAHLGHRNVHALGDLFAGRFAAELLPQAGGWCAPVLLIVSIMCTRNTNRARLVGDGARDGLPDPPCRIRRKLVTAAPFELCPPPSSGRCCPFQ